MSRGSFDGIANKFDQNIYGTTKGRLRHELLLHHLKDVLNSNRKLSVLDVGGGTGVMSAEFAKRGHDVVIADISDEALDIAKQRLAAYSNVVYTNLDVAHMTCANTAGQDKSEQGASVQNSSVDRPDNSIIKHFDVIICHALLEWLPQPLTVLSTLLEQLKPKGIFSLSFFNQDAMLFNNALYGNFDYIEKGMKVRNVVRLNPHNPQSPKTVLAHLDALDEYTVELTAGLRCFHDYMRKPEMQNSHYPQLLALEKQYGASEPYKWLGKYFYIQLSRSTSKTTKM